jgi:hypothetical protein
METSTISFDNLTLAELEKLKKSIDLAYGKQKAKAIKDVKSVEKSAISYTLTYYTPAYGDLVYHLSYSGGQTKVWKSVLGTGGKVKGPMVYTNKWICVDLNQIKLMIVKGEI